MSEKQFIRTKLNLSISLIIGGMLASPAALSEEKYSEERKIEVIEVTAQKRTQSLQDVPITITTVGEEELLNAGVSTVQDLTSLVPSLNITSAAQPAMSSITLRGAGTGASDPTLQPSVGVFIDGVYMPRSVYGLSDLVDINRVEVLLGPQGTLYGKNTNSGVISVSTKGAPDEMEIQAAVTAGSDNRKDAQITFANEINDDMSFRLGMMSRTQDGHVEDVKTGDTLSNVDKLSFRGQFFWDITPDLSLRAIAYTSRDSGGTHVFDTHFEPGSTYYNTLNLYAQGNISSIIDDDVNNRKVNINDQGLSPELKADGGSLHLEYNAGNLTFTSISAYQEWSQNDYVNDIDGTALDISSTIDNMSETSFSQELRVSSFGNESFDWVAGLFYFNSELDRGNGDDPYSVYTMGLPFVPSPPALAGISPNLVNAGDYATWNNHYESDSVAAFTQGTWYLSKDTTIVVGARYGRESISLDMDATAYDGFGTQLNLMNLLTGAYKGGSFIPLATGGINEILPGLMAILGGADPSTIDMTAGPVQRSGSRDDNDFTGMLSINHKIDDAMYFATVSTGAKSGGFNGSFGSDSIDDREFEQESTVNYEVGVKMDLLDGTMRLNTSYFHTVYKDFQSASFDPVKVAFVVKNAGQQTTQGIDLDLTYLITDNLSINAKVEYLDAKYNDYKGAQCSPSADIPDGDWEFNHPSDPTKVTGCTLDGQTLEFAPKWSGSINFDYYRELENGEIYTNLNNNFKSDYLADPTRASYAEADYSLWNARIGWRNDNWDISLWGKNITDEQYGEIFTGNVLGNLLLAPGEKPSAYNVWHNNPSTFGLTVRYNFL